MTKEVPILKTVWTGAMKGRGAIKGRSLHTDIGIPIELGGSGTGTDPKELLIASAATCYTFTLIAMLEAEKLPVIGLDIDSEIRKSRESKMVIIHTAHALLSADATEEQLHRASVVFSSAHERCFIGGILRAAGIDVEIQGTASPQLPSS
ncbi:hypothetical protein BFW87_00580 [Pseudomonas fluorescens]|uniref:Osmotically inducible protein OsmC n=1 Tax=Pseudomonas fluorescens TaxID=294 RepID=A0A1T2ZA54_PSEFL|nr:OsmC family protein [Pseudomonas fluorescens]OPB00937.1 hypothetical protein BFW87_00580 [Pseudomonas fluorescens]